MKRALIKLVKYLMVPIGMVRSLFKPSGDIRILMYHRVNDDVNKEICVTNANFRWQMQYLKKKGYRIISLDEALHLSRSDDRSEGKYAVLTFDDGYEDFFSGAYPVLCEFGYEAIVYLVPGRIGTDHVFWWDRDLGESKLMSWEQVDTLNDSPIIELGSHTMTHRDLNQLSEEETWSELSRSRDILQQRWGKPIRHFSYPRGIMTPCAREASRQLYETAVSIFDGNDINMGQGGDPMMIKRLPVQGSDGKFLFGPRLRGWLIAEEWLKKMLGRH